MRTYICSIDELKKACNDPSTKKEELRQILQVTIQRLEDVEKRNELAEPILGVIEQIASEAAYDEVEAFKEGSRR